MNTKHKKIMKKVFENPLRSDVNWLDLEKLVVALGGEITQGSGSRVILELNGTPAVFHRPHPKKVTDKGALRSFRRFLISAGVNDDGV